jgi:3-hydroxyacyl-CoA dehydrogenase
VDQHALGRGLGKCEANWQRSVASGRMSEAEYGTRRARLTGTTDFEAAVGEADLVIEAVFEDMDVKREVFSRLDRAARPGVVLASNTSTLDIDRIASATTRA